MKGHQINQRTGYLIQMEYKEHQRSIKTQGEYLVVILPHLQIEMNKGYFYLFIFFCKKKVEILIGKFIQN